MSEPPNIRVIEPPKMNYPEMTKYLEHKAKQAREGKIRSVTILVEYMDGETSSQSFHGEGTHPARIVGELELLKHSIIHEEDQRRLGLNEDG